MDKDIEGCFLRPGGEYETVERLEVTVLGRVKEGQEPIFRLSVGSRVKVLLYHHRDDSYVTFRVLEAPEMDKRMTVGTFFSKKREFMLAAMTCGELIAVIKCVPEGAKAHAD